MSDKEMKETYCAMCLRTSTVVDMSDCPFCNPKQTTPCPCTNCTSPRNAELKEVKFRLEELLFYIKKIMEEDEKTN